MPISNRSSGGKMSLRSGIDKAILDYIKNKLDEIAVSVRSPEVSSQRTSKDTSEELEKSLLYISDQIEKTKTRIEVLNKNVLDNTDYLYNIYNEMKEIRKTQLEDRGNINRTKTATTTLEKELAELREKNKQSREELRAEIAKFRPKPLNSSKPRSVLEKNSNKNSKPQSRFR